MTEPLLAAKSGALRILLGSFLLLLGLMMLSLFILFLVLLLSGEMDSDVLGLSITAIPGALSYLLLRSAQLVLAAPARSLGWRRLIQLMVGGLLIASLSISVVISVTMELIQQRQIALRAEDVARRQAELAPLSALDREVEEFRAEKEEFNRRIDLINALKTSQQVPFVTARAWVWLARSPDLIVDSISVGGDGTLNINGRAAGNEETIRSLFLEPVTIDPKLEPLPSPRPETAPPVTPAGSLEEVLEPTGEASGPPPPFYVRMEVQDLKIRNRCGEGTSKESKCVDFVLRLKVAAA